MRLNDFVRFLYCVIECMRTWWKMPQKISFLKINLPIWLLQHVELPEIIGRRRLYSRRLNRSSNKNIYLRLSQNIFGKIYKITLLISVYFYNKFSLPLNGRVTFLNSLSEVISPTTVLKTPIFLNFLCSYLDLLVDYSYALDAFHYWSQLYLETEPRLPLSNSKSQTMRVPETIHSIQKTEIDSFTRVSLF